MDPLLESRLLMNRLQFFGKTATGLGTLALGGLLGRDLLAASPENQFPNFPAKAKRVIYLFQSGAPSQMDLFDWKPQMRVQYDVDLPDSIRQGQRLTGMTVGQKRFPVAPTIFDFKQHGESGAWVSELMPNVARISDKLCFIKSMHTEAINHDPAITFFQTGSQIAGRPSVGAWLSYGLGRMNEDLPAFVAMVSTGTGRPGGQPLYDRLWGSGFLPTTHQGVKFRGVGDPVLYLNNPDGMDQNTRRRMLDDLNTINQYRYEQAGDPEIATRIAQYELAYRMQTSVPDLADTSDEPDSTFEAYGPESRKRGTYASNCIMARRLIERDVRFVQLFHMGWDQHKTLPKQIKGQCYDTDQATAALIEDLEQRGLLQDTLVVWGGEFGRTIYSQGTLSESDYGRDHHPRCFTIFLTGAGVKQGITYGATDEYCYNITENPVHVHDLHATLLHILGIDHKRLTYKFQGRHYRLTDVHGKVVKGILA
jgi:uncharacterized protein (DUF1501 family)